jgi:hypothetical protein
MKSTDNEKTQEQLDFEQNASANINKTDLFLKQLKKNYIILLIPVVLIGSYFIYKKIKK